MIESNRRRKTVVMSVGGLLFVVLAVVTGQLTIWGSAAAINFIGLADPIR